MRKPDHYDKAFVWSVWSILAFIAILTIANTVFEGSRP